MNNGIFVLDRLEKVAKQIRTYHSTNDITMLRHTKAGNVHSLVPADGTSVPDQLVVGMFVATEPFNSGDSMQVDGKDVTIKLHNSYAIDGLFLAGDCIEVVIDMSSSTVFMLNPNAYRQDVLRRWEISPLMGNIEHGADSYSFEFPDDGIYRITFISGGCLATSPLCNANYNQDPPIPIPPGGTTSSPITHVVSGLGGIGGSMISSVCEQLKGNYLHANFTHTHIPTPFSDGASSAYETFIQIRSSCGNSSMQKPFSFGYLADGETLSYPNTRDIPGSVLKGNLFNGNDGYSFSGWDMTMETHPSFSDLTWNPPQPGGKLMGFNRENIPTVLKQYITDEFQDVTTMTRINTGGDEIDDGDVPLSLDETIGADVPAGKYIYTPVYAPMPICGEPLLGDRTIHCYGLGGATGIGAIYKESGVNKMLTIPRYQPTTDSVRYGLPNWGLIIDKLS